MTSFFNPEEINQRYEETLQAWIEATAEEDIEALADILDLQPEYELTLADVGPRNLPLGSILAALGLCKHLKVLITKKQIKLIEPFKAAARCGQAEVIDYLLSEHHAQLSANQNTYEKMMLAAAKSAAKYQHLGALKQLTLKSPISISIDDLLGWMTQQSVVNVPADGNCFFHAIIFEAKRKNLPWSYFSHDMLRRETVDYMVQNKAVFKDYFTEQETLESYAATMSQLGEWADGAVMEAFAKAFGINLYITDVTDELQVRQMKFDENSRSETIRILRHGFHYRALVPENSHYVASVQPPLAFDNQFFANKIQESVEVNALDIQTTNYKGLAENAHRMAVELNDHVEPEIDRDLTRLDHTKLQEVYEQLSITTQMLVFKDPNVVERAAFAASAGIRVDKEDPNVNILRALSLQLASYFAMETLLYTEDYIALNLKTVIAFSKAACETMPAIKKQYQTSGEQMFWQSAPCMEKKQENYLQYIQLVKKYGI